MTKKKSTTSIKCTGCGREAELFSGIKQNAWYEGLCERCVGTFGSAEFARRYDRQWQRRHYAKDILQSDDEGYVKAYGADKARERGWSEADIRRYS